MPTDPTLDSAAQAEAARIQAAAAAAELARDTAQRRKARAEAPSYGGCVAGAVTRTAVLQPAGS